MNWKRLCVKSEHLKRICYYYLLSLIIFWGSVWVRADHTCTLWLDLQVPNFQLNQFSHHGSLDSLSLWTVWVSSPDNSIRSSIRWLEKLKKKEMENHVSDSRTFSALILASFPVGFLSLIALLVLGFLVAILAIALLLNTSFVCNSTLLRCLKQQNTFRG